MAIDYVEIRNADREIIGIIDTAKSIIWHSVYFGVGDFEIYAMATKEIVALLAVDNYITRPNNNEIGIIEKIEITSSVENGRVIVASGRFSKSILERRLIYQLSGHTNSPTILRGNVETEIRKLILNNAINCSFDNKRNIPILELGAAAGLPAVIVDDKGQATQKQVSFQNLLHYTDDVLQEYNYGARVILGGENKLQYICYSGDDRSGEVVFSEEFDNLSESNYLFDKSTFKNAALIGGEGEGLARFYSLIKGNKQGLERRELWVDASSITKAGENQQSYSDDEYDEMLIQNGKQQLAMLANVESFDGAINIVFSRWKYNIDYFLGDLVCVEDKKINKSAVVRITEATEIQDENGYAVNLIYE